MHIIIHKYTPSAVIPKILSKKHETLGSSVSVSACTALDVFDQVEIQEDDTIHEKKGEMTDHLAEEVKTSNSQQTKKERNEVSPPASVVQPPIPFPLDPLIAKYLCSKPAITENLSKEIQVSINVDDSRGTMTISQTDVSPPNWPSTSIERLQFLLSDMVCRVDIAIPGEAANTLYPLIMQRCTKEGLMYAFGQGDNKMSIAGDTVLVTKLQQDMNELSRRIIKVTEVIKLNPEEYTFFKKCKLSIVQKQHQSLQLKCEDSDQSISARGSIADVAQLKEKLDQYCRYCKVPVNLPHVAVQFLQTGDILDRLTQGTNLVPFIGSEGRILTLILLCTEEKAHHAESVAMKIGDQIKCESIDLPQYFQSHVAHRQTFANLKQSLYKKYSHLSVIQEGKLLLVSTADILPQVRQVFSHFISEECSVTADIRLKKGVWRFLHSPSMEKKWADLVGQMRENGVIIVSSSKSSSPKPFVKIKGERDKVEVAKQSIIELQASVKEQQILIARPGVCQYFVGAPEGQLILRGVEKDAGVCIEMGVKDDEVDKQDEESMLLSNSPQFTRVCFGNTNEMKTVNVYVGDITRFNRAEVIVNAANEDLKHCGGVADHIAKVGGPMITRDSEEYRSRRGRVNTGSAVIFDRVGNLPSSYKAIVHAVGPRWDSSSAKDKNIALLRRAVRESLTKSRKYNSIALPAISGGIYGFPIDVCANTLVQAVVEFSKNDRDATLSEISFVVLQDNADVFLKAVKNHIESVRSFNEIPSTPILTTGGDQSDESQQESRRRRRGSSKPTTPTGTSPSVDMGSTPRSRRLHQATSKHSNAYRSIKLTNGDILRHQVNYFKSKLMYFNCTVFLSRKKFW